MTQALTVLPAPASKMLICSRCADPYDWVESTSGLKMTYCTSLCEKGALGFTIETLLKAEIERSAWRDIEIPELPEPAAVTTETRVGPEGSNLFA
jgi:hypothetical protein